MTFMKKLDIDTHSNGIIQSVPLQDLELGLIKTAVAHPLKSVQPASYDFMALLEGRPEPPVTLDAFRYYLTLVEHSVENLDFYESVQVFKQLHDSAVQCRWLALTSTSSLCETTSLESDMSITVYNLMFMMADQFLRPGADNEINLPASIRDPLLRQIKQMESIAHEASLYELPSYHLFQKAEIQIYLLMQKDSLPRFLNQFKENVSCPRKVFCFLVCIVFGSLFSFLYLYQILAGLDQKSRLWLLPFLFFFVISGYQLHRRVCIVLWAKQIMQCFEKSSPSVQSAIFRRVTDPLIRALQSQYLLHVLIRAFLLFCILSIPVILTPSIRGYEWNYFNK